MKVLLIIPSYNEEKNIIKVYKEIKKYKEKVRKNTIDYIFINDGSTDNSEKIFKDKKINHINLINNLGIGGAVQTGYKYALERDYDVAIQFDGDGQHDINYIEGLLEKIEDGFNLIIGSRFIEEKSEFKSTKLRRVGINIISRFIQIFTKKKIYDTTSGFRACDKRIIKEFAQEYPTEYPEPISTVEIIKKGYNYCEIPVEMKERQDGISSIRAWKNIYYMFNVIISIIITGIRSYKK